MIRNIVFDFGGVLVDWDPRYYYRTVFADEERMEYFLHNICTQEWNARHDRGVPFADNIARLQALHPEWAREIGLYRVGWPTMLRADKPETVAVLRELVAAGYDIYGLTNWSAETIDIAFERYPFFALMRGIVVSGREGVIKPDPRLYRILLDRYGLRPDECVFIDDNADNVAAARALEMRGIQFTDAAALRRDLNSILAQ